eukprot:CAMPEP_0169182954 /NCGR_PEP_ID=MMETSP1016-20121227/366_1 /TAXON_ID=342587 /ORGANISM="Karlodinium micrum, Strain CCMP2283" /LENGTH=271 /DNA_ID=CAMNT_0009258281 /DNA_START=146 /DNA_END=958 /DNA_ORIENTATION=-
MDEPDFLVALAATFSESGFVASFPVGNPSGKPFFAICRIEDSSPSHPVNDVATTSRCLSLTVTDCLSGIFCRRFGISEFAEIRRNVGMAEFAWGGFLKLLSSAFRNQGGCSVVVDLKAPDTSSSSLRSHMILTLRFQLEAAALVTSIDMGSSSAAPVAIPGLDSYLRELHGFVVGAISAASGTSTSQAHHPTCIGDDTLQMPTLHLGGGASLFTVSATPAMLSSERKFESVASAPPAPKAPTTRKRVGGSLVEPHVRKARGGGANPFQLSR